MSLPGLKPLRPSVLIVDDHAGFRESARGLLEAEGFDVVGMAGDSDEAMAEAIRLRPDLVLLDVRLPGVDGFGTAEMLAGLNPAPVVVVTSSHPVSSYRTQLAAAPVRGFLAKSDLTGAALAAFLV
ncbi:MAG: response regulator transcription factor [Acidimicrobiia bacterium]